MPTRLGTHILKSQLVGAGGKSSPLPRRSRVGGNPAVLKKFCEADQLLGFVRFAEYCSCWIPAFTGMTVLMENLGLMIIASGLA